MKTFFDKIYWRLYFIFLWIFYPYTRYEEYWIARQNYYWELALTGFVEDWSKWPYETI